MPLALLFSVANSVALAGWLALAFGPVRRPLTQLVVPAVATVLAMVYTALIASFWMQGTGDFGSLDGVGRLFQHRGLLLAGWVHYLAFDLLVGWWERQEAQRLRISRWVLLPCLFLTFMFGPIGWLAFLAVRYFRQRVAGPDVRPDPA
jgi:hypothetical protein